MPTKRYGYNTTYTDDVTEYTGDEIARLHRISDTQGGGALEAFGVGVLPDPDANSLKITAAGGGRNIQIAAGRGFGRHSTYGGFFLQLEAPLSLSGLAPSSTLFIFAALDVSAENDTRETGAPLVVVQAGSSLDGGLPLAQVVTGASAITSITDLRQFVTLGGTAGSVWRTGSGAPSNALGADGDFYLRSDTGEFYEKVSGAYVSRGSLKGATGAAGTNGTNGTNGQDGATALFGTGAPDDGDGSDGDFFVNNSSGALYLKTAGAWLFQTNLTGPEGAPGGSLNWIETGWESGESYEANDALAHGNPASSYRASVAHTASSTTEPGVGADWQTVWMVTAAAGQTGATGASGTLWRNGTTVPGSGLGSDGDFYFNTANADVYKKISAAWSFQVNLKGLKGDKGDTGDTGATGATGAKGDAGDAGPGVPSGGTAGQILAKASGADYDDEWIDAPSGGGGTGTANQREISQTAHGLRVGDWIQFTTDYSQAQADEAANAEVLGIVAAVADADNFTLASDGFVSGLSGLSESLYFLDPSTPGAMTQTEPSVSGQISRPVFFAVSATAGYILNYRGYVVPEVGEGGGGVSEGALPWYQEIHAWYGADLTLSSGAQYGGIFDALSQVLYLPALDNEAVYQVALSAGTWDFLVGSGTAGTYGIATLRLDDLIIGTLDFYQSGGGGSDDKVFAINDVSITETKKYLLKIKMESKNAGASGYSAVLNRIILRRTA